MTPTCKISNDRQKKQTHTDTHTHTRTHTDMVDDVVEEDDGDG